MVSMQSFYIFLLSIDKLILLSIFYFVFGTIDNATRRIGRRTWLDNSRWNSQCGYNGSAANTWKRARATSTGIGTKAIERREWTIDKSPRTWTKTIHEGKRHDLSVINYYKFSLLCQRLQNGYTKQFNDHLNTKNFPFDVQFPDKFQFSFDFYVFRQVNFIFSSCPQNISQSIFFPICRFPLFLCRFKKMKYRQSQSNHWLIDLWNRCFRRWCHR